MWSPRVGLQLGRQRRRQARSSAAASASSPAARRTSGSRTSTATPASSSRASAPASTPPTASRSCPIRSNQPTTVTGATPALHERDRRDRPRLQVPAAVARQPRLRPRPRHLGPGRHRRVSDSSTLKDIAYQNLNLVPGPNTCSDGRPIFVARANTASATSSCSPTPTRAAVERQRQAGAAFRNGLYARARTSTAGRES